MKPPPSPLPLSTQKEAGRQRENNQIKLSYQTFIVSESFVVVFSWNTICIQINTWIISTRNDAARKYYTVLSWNEYNVKIHLHFNLFYGKFEEFDTNIFVFPAWKKVYCFRLQASVQKKCFLGGVVVLTPVSLPLDRPSWVQISARGRGGGRSHCEYCTNNMVGS